MFGLHNTIVYMNLCIIFQVFWNHTKEQTKLCSSNSLKSFDISVKFVLIKT